MFVPGRNPYTTLIRMMGRRDTPVTGFMKKGVSFRKPAAKSIPMRPKMAPLAPTEIVSW